MSHKDGADHIDVPDPLSVRDSESPNVTSNQCADLPLRMRACATRPRYIGETRDLFIEGADEIERLTAEIGRLTESYARAGLLEHPRGEAPDPVVVDTKETKETKHE